MKPFLCLLCTLLLALPAWADRARPPRDYVQPVGESHVFVMLAARGDPFDAGAPDDVGVLDPDKALRKAYPASGLYARGSAEPLWTVPWYAFEVFPDSDGVHLVRLGPWASTVDQLALSFHERGVEVKRYLIRDLVRDAGKLRHTVSHFFWLAEKNYDDGADVLTIKTVEGQTYRFSSATGERLPENPVK